MKTLKIGIAGARGLSVMAAMRQIPEVEVSALCDINSELLAKQAKEHGIPNTYQVFEDMIATDLDAVIVATPMQYHVAQSLLALNAGLHVLSEVPAGVSLEELFWLCRETEKSGKVFMMAENYLYTTENQLVLALAKAGKFGEPYFGVGEYLHNMHSYMTYPNGTPSWRRWWQWGQRGIFYPTHSLGPVMKWFQGDHIDYVVAMGSGWHARPENRLDDTSVALLQMKSGKMIQLRLDCLSNRPHALFNYALQGTGGVYESARFEGDRHRVCFFEPGDDPDKAQWSDLMDYKEYLPERYKNPCEAAVKAGHGGGDYFIVQDFIDAIKGIKPPEINVYEACEWSAVAVLSALSVSNRGRAIEMPDFTSKDNRDMILKL